jgi:hypothetical protein
MIVRIHSNGTSFKGAAAYLNHDPDKAKTSERVAWTNNHRARFVLVLNQSSNMISRRADAKNG